MFPGTDCTQSKYWLGSSQVEIVMRERQSEKAHIDSLEYLCRHLLSI